MGYTIGKFAGPGSRPVLFIKIFVPMIFGLAVNIWLTSGPQIMNIISLIY